MKKLFLLLFTGLSGLTIAQDDVNIATFGDDSEVKYTLNSVEALDAPKLTVWAFDLNARSTFSVGLSAQYTLPEYFITKLHVGYGKIGIENSVFFKTMEKRSHLE